MTEYCVPTRDRRGKRIAYRRALRKVEGVFTALFGGWSRFEGHGSYLTATGRIEAVVKQIKPTSGKRGGKRLLAVESHYWARNFPHEWSELERFENRWELIDEVAR